MEGTFVFNLPFTIGVGTPLTDEQQSQIVAGDDVQRDHIKTECRAALRREFQSLLSDETQFDHFFNFQFDRRFDETKQVLSATANHEPG